MSETAIKRIDQKIDELKTKQYELERPILKSDDDSSRRIAPIVQVNIASLKELSGLLIELLKMDRTRALFTTQKQNQSWCLYAQSRLSAFHDWQWNRLPSLIAVFSNAPQDGVQAQNEVFQAFKLISNGLSIDLIDQHIVGRIAMRDKAIQWVKYGVSAGVGAVGHYIATHWLKL
ncbi:hypothetical protein [Dyella sp. SG609]|uniref:hypothetical protein n=1 Tax=Dyella sp. SG609 TaxID=2587018 RepID=UPI001444FF88|nr:hypothetical protein [Dyella sp. SG609]NKJ23635.1 hypothetical protein [Dyella sp. SG609]